MKSVSKVETIRQVSKLLAELIGLAPGEVRRRAGLRESAAAAVLEAGPFVFFLEWKSSGAAGPVAAAAKRARKHVTVLGGQAIPLVAVPYMGRVGREQCERAEVSWVDLSGNARIFAPGLRVVVDGRPNRFKRRGRPASVFAPKASRIVRWLLVHPNQSMSQREIAQATDMDEGYTSRVVRKLEDEMFVVRDAVGRIRPRDPDLLLDAWREEYRFDRHRILEGHVAARSGDELLRRLTGMLGARGVEYAATGLGAAWTMSPHAAFRLVTIFLPDPPAPALLDEISFREGSPGANVWLVEPNDQGVFQGALDRDGVRCVHPVQVYLDLAGHPGRSEEAAVELRKRFLRWKTDA